MIDTSDTDFEDTRDKRHPFTQLLIFIVVFTVFFFIGNIVGAGLITAIYGVKTLLAIGSLNIAAPHFVAALWILQIAGTTLPILIAPLIFSYAVTNHPQEYLKAGFRFPWGLIVVILTIMFISAPVIEFLSNINQKMVLPPFLKWMRDSENSAQKITEAMLHMNNIFDLVVDVLLIGLLTAIVEEFMFRGVLQTIFIRWTNSTHAAIWITAVLFSAFHMEFFGFLPRLMLGLLFGYFVAWSGSIWTGVWAHFINNTTAVIVTYLFSHKLIKLDPDDQHVFNYSGYLFSFVVLLFLLFLYRKIAYENKQLSEH